jgi:hypothetical protein
MRAKIEAELGQRHLEELRGEWLRGLRKNAEIKTNESFLETLR